MRWPTESEAQCIEDNLTGFRDSRSLTQFRGVFPSVVVRLAESGLDIDQARWAAGQATMREPEGGISDIHKSALKILDLRAAA